MRPEPRTPALANMSAPPRSTVTLPRLTPRSGAPGAHGDGSPTGDDASIRSAREVPVGPGGGQLLSSALCLARVELPAAVCAHLRMSLASRLMRAPLGLARALVAIARRAGQADGASAQGRAAGLELDRVIPLSEGALVQELAARLEAVEWPGWVPRVAFVTPLGKDIATGVDPATPGAPAGVACPLLAARLVAGIRGPAFLRGAAPTLSNLLNLWGGATPSGTWELWLPVEPGRVRPLPPPLDSTQGSCS